jgi:hypothetical protein
MAFEFPRCSMCRVTIQSGEPVIFGRDGRVQHTTCPTVTCPTCGLAILPAQPIRRDGETMLHGNCWAKHYRALRRTA